jgi:hypothetical protein
MVSDGSANDYSKVVSGGESARHWLALRFRVHYDVAFAPTIHL